MNIALNKTDDMLFDDLKSNGIIQASLLQAIDDFGRAHTETEYSDSVLDKTLDQFDIAFQNIQKVEHAYNDVIVDLKEKSPIILSTELLETQIKSFDWVVMNLF